MEIEARQSMNTRPQLAINQETPPRHGSEIPFFSLFIYNGESFSALVSEDSVHMASMKGSENKFLPKHYTNEYSLVFHLSSHNSEPYHAHYSSKNDSNRSSDIEIHAADKACRCDYYPPRIHIKWGTILVSLINVT